MNAVQFCLMVKMLSGRPLRQTTGMVASILTLTNLDWPIPDFSTLNPRQGKITVKITNRRDPGPLSLLVGIEPWECHWPERPWRGGSSFSAMVSGRPANMACITAADIAKSIIGKTDRRAFDPPDQILVLLMPERFSDPPHIDHEYRHRRRPGGGVHLEQRS